MFGGSTSDSAEGGTQYGDTWEWDGNDWMKVSDSGPPGRINPGMAYDSIRKKVVLFSGYRKGWIWVNDTWEWDGNSWTLVNSSGPPPMNNPRLIFNEARSKIFLFSGHSAGFTHLSEMWEWDGVQWIQLFSPIVPPGRSWHFVAYDSDRQNVVLFGGYNPRLSPSKIYGDTWEWDWVDWREIDTQISPIPRYDLAMTYNVKKKEILLFGGYTEIGDSDETWVYRTRPLEVDIDIKPGSYPNSINLGSNGNIPVAIFSTPSFEATTVDPLTVTLAGALVRIKGKGTPQTSAEDVDGDGLLDLIVHVDTTALQLSLGDTEAILEGETYEGVSIRGVDTVRIVQE
jgi:hypothetical protein